MCLPFPVSLTHDFSVAPSLYLYAGCAGVPFYRRGSWHRPGRAAALKQCALCHTDGARAGKLEGAAGIDELASLNYPRETAAWFLFKVSSFSFVFLVFSRT